MGKKSVTVTVTGAGGQIAYAALFRIAAGDMLGPDQPITLKLLEIPEGVRAAEGVALELTDSAFPLLQGMEVTTDLKTGFDGANIALLVGARPRTKGMERGDLLEANGAIFAPQGRAINDHAAQDVRVLVVGNPANTNALIAQRNAPDVPAERFTALTRLDHNRAAGILAEHVGAQVADVEGVTVWGNHSPTQYPDLTHATVGGRPACEVADPEWIRGPYVERVAKRGAEIIEVRGSSSAASAAGASIDHMRDWVLGTGERWTSVALPSRGWYGVPEGLVCSFPARSSGGRWSVVEDLSMDEFSAGKLAASVAELEAERDAVKDLLGH